MAYLKRPQKGDKVLQSLFDSVNSIIDYLPTITVRGDNYSTYVEHSNCGTVIHAKQPYDTDQTGKGSDYYAGSGIIFTSGNIINAKLSAGPNIKIDYNSGYLVISGTPEGSGGGPSGPDNDTTYTGDYNATGSGWISVNSSGDNPHVISCRLARIDNLKNDNLVVDVHAYPTATGNKDHFMQLSDFFSYSGGTYSEGHEGAGTKIRYHYYSTGNHDQQGRLCKLPGYGG